MTSPFNLLIVGFAALACICGFFALFKWNSVVRAYSAKPQLKPKEFDFKRQTGRVGPTGFTGCLNIAFLKEGLYLECSFPFSAVPFFGTPLLIPWHTLAQENGGKPNFLGAVSFLIMPEEIKLRVHKDVAQKIDEYLAQHGKP